MTYAFFTSIAVVALVRLRKSLDQEGPRRSDAVLLWNDVQRDEATRLHAVPPERVALTGAHTFDPWFARRPSEDRAGFCARLGFDPARPIVLYLCSSVAIARTARDLARADLPWPITPASTTLGLVSSPAAYSAQGSKQNGPPVIASIPTRAPVVHGRAARNG